MSTLQMTLFVGLLLSTSPDASASEPASRSTDKKWSTWPLEGCWVADKETPSGSWFMLHHQLQEYTRPGPLVLPAYRVVVSCYHLERPATKDDKKITTPEEDLAAEALIVFFQDNTLAYVWRNDDKEPVVEYKVVVNKPSQVKLTPKLSKHGKHILTYEWTTDETKGETVEVRITSKIDGEKKPLFEAFFKKGDSCPQSASDAPSK